MKIFLEAVTNSFQVSDDYSIFISHNIFDLYRILYLNILYYFAEA